VRTNEWIESVKALTVEDLMILSRADETLKWARDEIVHRVESRGLPHDRGERSLVYEQVSVGSIQRFLIAVLGEMLVERDWLGIAIPGMPGYRYDRQSRLNVTVVWGPDTHECELGLTIDDIVPVITTNDYGVLDHEPQQCRCGEWEDRWVVLLRLDASVSEIAEAVRD
jgi:hypothetical protein